MDQQRWQKMEMIIDNALSMANYEQQKMYIRKVCESDQQLYEITIQWLQAIQKSEDIEFLKH